MLARLPQNGFGLVFGLVLVEIGYFLQSSIVCFEEDRLRCLERVPGIYMLQDPLAAARLD